MYKAEMLYINEKEIGGNLSLLWRL